MVQTQNKRAMCENSMFAGIMVALMFGTPTMQPRDAAVIHLPKPRLKSAVSVEEVLAQRRSMREYDKRRALAIEELSQLLWSAQGVTSAEGFRTAPSAGALYPLEVHVVAGQVQNLPAGIYRYKPHGHRLEGVAEGDRRTEIARAALEQESLYDAPATIAISAVYQRTTQKYGERGRRYALLEAGHAAQNILLQAVALGLESVPIGAFQDHAMKKVLRLQQDEEPLYLIPVGRK